MNVHIDAHHIELPDTVTVEQRVRRSLSRFAEHLRRVTVTLRDDNGPRGGRDKVCTLRVELQGGGGQIIVIDRSASLQRAITRNLRRSRLLVARALKRRRSALRQPRLPLEPQPAA